MRVAGRHGRFGGVASQAAPKACQRKTSRWQPESAIVADGKAVNGANGYAADFESGIVGEGAENEQRILGLDAVFLDLDFLLEIEAAHAQKAADVGGDAESWRKDRLAEFFFEIAMNVEVRALRVNKDASRVVVEVERHVEALIDLFDPGVVFPATLPLPDHGSKVVARTSRDGCNQGVRAGGEAADFDESHSGAADLGGRRVLDEALALEEKESAVKEKQADGRAHGGPDAKGVWRSGDDGGEDIHAFSSARKGVEPSLTEWQGWRSRKVGAVDYVGHGWADGSGLL